MKRRSAITASIIVVLAGVLGVAFAVNPPHLAILQPIRASATVLMTADAFEPSTINVYRETEVCFENDDTAPHWPASGNHSTHAIYPEFDPRRAIEPGDTWCFTFDLTGNWRYHDHLYPEVTGVISVTGK